MLSIRNLLRQKKRNILLGIGIAFGMMILVIANSFSHGMVDVLINDVVSHAFGHLVVNGKPANSYYSTIRDKERIMKIIHESIPKEEIVTIEESLGMFGRAIGNGEADNVVVVGVKPETDNDQADFFEEFFTLVEGDFSNYFSKEIEYPVIISEEKAKSLKVKINDTIRVRLPMITGQMQAVKLTVIAIANANNSFMNIILFMEADRVKKLLGYKPWESADLQITLKDPKKTAKKYAEILHSKLNPEVISISGQVAEEPAFLLAFQNNSAAKNVLKKNLKLTQGDLEKGLAKKGVMVSNILAQKLGLQPGSKFIYQYETKFRGLREEKLTVDAIYQSHSALGQNVVLVNEEVIHENLNRYLPKTLDSTLVASSNSLHSILATEWKLLERSDNVDALKKKYKTEKKRKSKQNNFDLITMYEGASQILQMEYVLNMITGIAVLVLFFIILVGVINTLRMTIKERTREIGTVRAIGMQKKDVRNMFIIETLILTALSCIAGVVLGMGVIKGLSLIEFNTTNFLSVILKNKHLYFKPSIMILSSYFLFIMMLTGIITYFPARKAAKLTAVEALRHYE